MIDEPGYVSYEVFTVEDDPLRYGIVEWWSTPADVRRHADRIVANRWANRSSNLLAAPLNTTVLHPLPSATEETRS